MLINQQVGRFELRDYVGRGAYGDVYLAWDPERGEEVALKLLRLADTDPELLQAEKNGIALQEQLSRVAPQVAAVYGQGEEGDLFWVEMEYVEGTDLSRILGRGPLPPERAVGIALQLCELLEASHSFAAEIGGRRVFGIIHGDIKPQNIRLQDGDRVRILDFGIAKQISQTRSFTRNLFGSLPYTPPERLERGIVDSRSDLWAVGVVLYLMLAGRPPYRGEDPEDLERRIRQGEPPEPLPEGCPAGLKRIVVKSLAFDPARRHRNAAELKTELEAWRDGRLAAEAPRGADPQATRRTVEVEPAAAPGIVPMAAPGFVPMAAPGAAGGDPAAVPGVDPSSATRRTERIEPPAVEETRRTAGTEPLVGPPPPSPPAAAEPAPARRRAGWKFVALLLFALGASQAWVWSQAAQIRRELATGSPPDLEAIAERYRKVASLSLLGSSLGGLGEDLHDELVNAAGRVLKSYHGDDPKTREGDWRRAETYLRAAVEFRPRDPKTRAWLDYTRAQLDRISAQTAGNPEEARQALRKAISGFEEAARRDPAFPDPYLGLARIYAYGLFDLEKLKGALEELTRHGYPQGRREKAMLADGCRTRAVALQARADGTREPVERREVLYEAREHLEQAIATYAELGAYANVPTNRRDAERRLAQIEEQLWQLEEAL